MYQVKQWVCKFSICYSALVLLNAITASWTSQAEMTVSRIRKWDSILCQVVDKSSAAAKFVKKTLILIKIMPRGVLVCFA